MNSSQAKLNFFINEPTELFSFLTLPHYHIIIVYGRDIFVQENTTDTDITDRGGNWITENFARKSQSG